MIGQQKVTRIIVVTFMFIWLSGHEVNATTDRRIQARTENGIPTYSVSIYNIVYIKISNQV